MELERLTFSTLYDLGRYLRNACYITADVTLPARKPNRGTVISICFEDFSVFFEDGLIIEEHWGSLLIFKGEFLYASGHTVGEGEDKLDIITVRFADQEPITLAVFIPEDDF